MISIVGKKDAGKTSLVVALAAELARQGKLRVMTIKHGTHAADVDQRGKDTWRHYHEGKAERVVMEAPGQRLIWERREREADPISLARHYLDGADLVLVEGFAAQPLPKIEAYPLARGPDPLFHPSRPDTEPCVAIVTAH